MSKVKPFIQLFTQGIASDWTFWVHVAFKKAKRSLIIKEVSVNTAFSMWLLMYIDSDGK